MPYTYEVMLEDIVGEAHQAQDYSAEEPVSAGEIIELPDGLRCHVKGVHLDETRTAGLITADLQFEEIDPISGERFA
jgi:hypothetical protein